MIVPQRYNWKLSMSQVSGPDTTLGLDGFTFADLHRPARLRDLYARFVDAGEEHRARIVGAVGTVSRSA